MISKRLVGPKQLENTTTTQYTVPTNVRTKLKSVWISNPTGGSVDVTASVGADAAGTRFLDGYPVAADEVVQFFNVATMEDGEILAMHASAATSLVAVVDGTEELVA